jgi:hypothetical protein
VMVTVALVPEERLPAAPLVTLLLLHVVPE